MEVPARGRDSPRGSVPAGRPGEGTLGLAALTSIGIGGMVGGGTFSVLGLTVEVAGSGAYLSFLVGGAVAALTGYSYARLSVTVRSRGGTAAFLDRAFGTRVAGPLNLLLWLSYFVMLGLYAVAFGAYLAALAGLDPDGIWRRIFGSLVVVVFAAVNLAAARLAGGGPAASAIPLAGAAACLGSFAALIAYAATHIPAQLGVLGGLIAAAVAGEALVRGRRGARREASVQ